MGRSILMEAPYTPERFDNVVEHYVAARSTYAPGLIDWLMSETGAAGHRVLDLGCGPGLIANAVAPLAAEVLGLDPSPNMIAAARANAHPKARFEIGSSEDLGHVEAPVHLVTIGRAFHWMNRAKTLAALDHLVAEGGAIALINDRPPELPMNAWWHAVNKVARRFAVQDAYNLYRASEAWVPHEEVLAGSRFCDLRSIAVFQTHVWSFDRLLRHTLSRSATTEALLGPRQAELETEMRSVLAAFGPGPWTSLNQHVALIARRRAPA